jgi:hypothetical protein
VHWTANFDEIQDFEHDVRNRFGGAGFLSDEALDSGTRNQPLGDSKAGLSPELDALAAYLESLDKVPPSPHRNTDGSLSAEAESGKLIVQKFRCASCHAGLDFTDSGNGLLHDVGTLRGTSGRRLGRRLEGLDTPTLKGLWQTAPYLHDGSAATLAGVLTTANSKQRHGALRTASAAEVRDLVAYLLQIDEREPPPPPTLVAARIVAPADRARFYEGTPVSIEVEARSDLGPVSRVEIRDGTTRIGVDALAPYVFSWKGAKKGAHVLNAIVTHGSGTRTQSQPVTIGVEAPLQARVNFQPAAAKVPVGYLPDTGEVFGERGSGFSYGWNTDNAAQARDRNAARSPDQRYDTFTHFQEPANPQAEWEIALPAGSYRVRTVAGDPKSFKGVFRLMAEGVLVLDGSPTPAKRWLDASAIVPVEDGRLTIRAAPGAIGAKICFVEIVRVGAPP